MSTSEPRLDLTACRENLDHYAETGDARSCRDIALALIAEVERLRHEVFVLTSSEDSQLAIVTAERDRLRDELAIALNGLQSILGRVRS